MALTAGRMFELGVLVSGLLHKLLASSASMLNLSRMLLITVFVWSELLSCKTRNKQLQI